MKVTYDKLRLIRNARRLSTKDFAAIIGVSPTHLNDIENGRSDLTVGRLCIIAKALDVPPQDLFQCEI